MSPHFNVWLLSHFTLFPNLLSYQYNFHISTNIIPLARQIFVEGEKILNKILKFIHERRGDQSNVPNEEDSLFTHRAVTVFMWAGQETHKNSTMDNIRPTLRIIKWEEIKKKFLGKKEKPN